MRVIIAGGGTAGHINPGIAIAKHIKKNDPKAEIVFVGTERGMETKLVPREGFELRLIKVRGFRRKLSKDTFIAVKELFQGLLEARKVIKEFNPDIVIGTGGYVCGPVVFNASSMKVPTLIHEQNAFPGATNRILSRFVDRVAISFKESEKYFKTPQKLVLTGNPVRKEMLEVDKSTARAKLGITEDRRMVVIMGGSLGAEKINSTVIEMINNYYKGNEFDITFATGNSQFEVISKQLEGSGKKGLNVVPYIYDAANIYAAADLIVCRAGAITSSELTAMGIPCIMIPSPNVTANHQEHNARALEKQGAAVVILERELRADLLYQQVYSLLKDKEQLGRMAKNSRKSGITNAVEKIYSLAKELAARGRG